MTTHVIRVQGRFVDIATKDQGATYIARHVADGANKDDFTVEPRAPYELHHRGSIVDVFHTRRELQDAFDKCVAEAPKPSHRRAAAPAADEGDAEVSVEPEHDHGFSIVAP